MLRMIDVKSNDFAYFDNVIEHPSTRSAVKGAFRYIVTLSNLASTPIDHWDIEQVFKGEDGWITDKGKINKAFFERKSAEPAKMLNVPEHLLKLLERPLMELVSGNVREIERSIANKKTNIATAYSQIQTHTRQLSELNRSLIAAQFARKGIETGLIGQVNKILAELPVELWAIESGSISFLCTTDTIVPYRDLPNGINRRYNLGRLIFTVNVADMSVKCYRRDLINRWANANQAHFHMGSYLCQGGFSSDFANAVNNTDIFLLMSVLMRWKDTYDQSSSLTTNSNFNHHPAFTEYLEGDVMLGKTELEQYEFICGEVFYCGPLMSTSGYQARLNSTVQASRNHNYSFQPGGGLIPGYIYDRERPLDSYRDGPPPKLPHMDFEEYLEWLCQHHDVAQYEFGEAAPKRIGYTHETLYADPDNGEWLDEDQLNERESGDGE